MECMENNSNLAQEKLNNKDDVEIDINHLLINFKNGSNDNKDKLLKKNAVFQIETVLDKKSNSTVISKEVNLANLIMKVKNKNEENKIEVEKNESNKFNNVENLKKCISNKQNDKDEKLFDMNNNLEKDIQVVNVSNLLSKLKINTNKEIISQHEKSESTLENGHSLLENEGKCSKIGSNFDLQDVEIHKDLCSLKKNILENKSNTDVQKILNEDSNLKSTSEVIKDAIDKVDLSLKKLNLSDSEDNDATKLLLRLRGKKKHHLVLGKENRSTPFDRKNNVENFDVSRLRQLSGGGMIENQNDIYPSFPFPEILENPDNIFFQVNFNNQNVDSSLAPQSPEVLSSSLSSYDSEFGSLYPNNSSPYSEGSSDFNNIASNDDSNLDILDSSFDEDDYNLVEFLLENYSKKPLINETNLNLDEQEKVKQIKNELKSINKPSDQDKTNNIHQDKTNNKNSFPCNESFVDLSSFIQDVQNLKLAKESLHLPNVSKLSHSKSSHIQNLGKNLPEILPKPVSDKAKKTLYNNELFSFDRMLLEELKLYKKIQKERLENKEAKAIFIIDEHGVDKHSKMQTNLHLAVINSNIEEIYAIIEITKQFYLNLSDINIKDKNEKTALDLAYEKNMPLIIDYLKENGASSFQACKV